MKKNINAASVTIDGIVKRAMARKENAAEPLRIYVPCIDGEMEFEKPSTYELMEYRRQLQKGEIDQTEMFIRVIYNASKLLQNKELHEQLGIKDPEDVVAKVFTLGEIVEIAGKILNHDDVEGDIEVIKN